MIHYHGLPITPATAARAAITGGHAFVSFRYPDQLSLAIDVCQSFAVDNGAFSAWKSGTPVTDWNRYYEWVADLHRCPLFDFAVIPDVIDGDEQANDALLAEWPWRGTPKNGWIGSPVWHMHESIDRLQRLSREWPRVSIGSSGQFKTVGNARWWGRMTEAMNSICDKQGRPVCKLHGLRMLNPEVFSKLPFSSADSTNIARNIGIDKAWHGSYTPTGKDVKAIVMRSLIESHQAMSFWTKRPAQVELI
ncbi:MAG TPA: hypothetical protein VMV98_05415 [Acidobacteriaceae bacterium]|nr:hypothetical protein [Acidobacteriaceae bacterium]